MLELPEQLLGRYQPLGVLGEGAQGLVVRARDRELGREVAVKLLELGAADEGTIAARFDREAKLASRIEHPGVVRVFDHGTAGGLGYLVTEFLPGGTLEEHLAASGGRLAAARARAVTASLLEGLAAIHDAGVVHRDLKLANVLLREDGYPAISDFGLGKTEDVEALTGTGMVVGTPYFMAPEQLEGQAATPAADLYALGLIHCKLRTGAMPFPAGDLNAMMQAKFAGLPALRTTGLSEGEAVFLRAVLEMRPEDRPADARVALALLRGEVGEDPGAARRGEEPPLPGEVTGALPRAGTDSAIAPAPGGRWSRTLAAFVGLGLLGVAWGLRLAPPEPAAPPPSPEAPAPDRFRPLLELHRRVLDSEPVRSGLSLTAAASSPQLLETWRRARSALTRQLEEGELARLLAAAGDAPPPPEALEVLADLRLIQLLLEGTRGEQEAPGAPGPLAGYLAGWMRIEPEFELGGPRESVRQEDDALGQTVLAARGGTWRVLRGVEDIPRFTLPGNSERVMDRRLRIQNYDGVGFVDPMADVGVEVQIMVRDNRKLDRPPPPLWVEFPLVDAGGEDLALALRGYGWEGARVMVLTLEGETSLRVVGAAPPRPDRGDHTRSTVRMGARILVDRRVVPAAPRRGVLRAFGLQAISNPDQNVGVEQVYQRLPAGG